MKYDCYHNNRGRIVTSTLDAEGGADSSLLDRLDGVMRIGGTITIEYMGCSETYSVKNGQKSKIKKAPTTNEKQ